MDWMTRMRTRLGAGCALLGLLAGVVLGADSGGAARQDGAGLPQSWGEREGWKIPAWYKVTLPAGDADAEREFVNALAALPHLSVTLPDEELFGTERGIYTHPMETGDAWERAATLVYTPDPRAAGATSVVTAGLRIQGGWNRRPEESPKHSFRLTFRARLGAPKWKVALFGGRSEGFDQLILRSGNNHSWLHWSGAERRQADYLRDPWMRASHAAMGHAAARSRPVHLFLNGLYWGVYDLAERPDGKFASDAWGGKEREYDSRNADKVLSGDALSWEALYALANGGVTNAAVYERMKGLLDVPAFCDYILLNLYGANADWDRGSNWYAARRREPAGPWRFFVWDGERTLEGVEDWRIDENDDLSPMRLFQQLRQWPEFRREFVERARRHLGPGGALSPERAADRYALLSEQLSPAMPAEAARWGDYRRTVHPYKEGPYETYTVKEHWKPEVTRLLKEYFPKRSGFVMERLAAW